MKNDKGITMLILVITIIVLVIIVSISIQSGNKVIMSSKLENLQTNMLLIQVKAKEYIENANFDLGTTIESVSAEEKNNRISKAKTELKGEEIVETSIFEGNINKTTEELQTENEQYIYYYKLRKNDLNDMGLNKVKTDQKNGIYIIKYDVKNLAVEVYNTVGFKDNNENSDTIYYSLSDIQNIKY